MNTANRLRTANTVNTADTVNTANIVNTAKTVITANTVRQQNMDQMGWPYEGEGILILTFFFIVKSSFISCHKLLCICVQM